MCGWSSRQPAWSVKSTRRWREDPLDAGAGPNRLTQAAERRWRVLLVEDEAIIAILMEDLLDELGCEVVATAAELDGAIAVARTGEFDLAFLDVNLRGVPVYPVAEVLRARAIPFAFVTGYGSTGVDATRVEAPILQKPFQSRDLAAVLRRLQARQPPVDS
jgi:CheY-like chemotaxis protein